MTSPRPATAAEATTVLPPPAGGSGTAWPFLAAAALLLAACAPALREPPPLATLSGGGPPAALEEVPGLLAAAEARFAQRTPAAARDAARLWLRAAAAGQGHAGALWKAASALVWAVEHEAEASARSQDALRAVHAAQWCARLAPDDPTCDYWLGAALGVQARERPRTGLSALPTIEAAFTRAAAAAPRLERGGPDRALALLYLRAPGWPAGPGDPDLGLEHAQRALALFPEHPPNLLAHGEALAALGRREASREAHEKALQAALALADAGDPDAGEWAAQAQEALGAGARK